jgi:hypothetical protein
MAPHTTALAAHAAAFERGTPDYYSLQEALASAAEEFTTHGGRVVDLSCSGGEWIAPMLANVSGMCQFIALDDVAASVEACMDRHKMLVHLGLVQPAQMDLEERFPETASRLTVSVLGMERLSEIRKAEVLDLVRMHLERGGAFILMERASGDWEIMLRYSGFREVRRIWRKGQFALWLAIK